MTSQEGVRDPQALNLLAVLEGLRQEAVGAGRERGLHDQGVPKGEALAPTAGDGRQDMGAFT